MGLSWYEAVFCRRLTNCEAADAGNLETIVSVVLPHLRFGEWGIAEGVVGGGDGNTRGGWGEASETAVFGNHQLVGGFAQGSAAGDDAVVAEGAQPTLLNVGDQIVRYEKEFTELLADARRARDEAIRAAEESRESRQNLEESLDRLRDLQDVPNFFDGRE